MVDHMTVVHLLYPPAAARYIKREPGDDVRLPHTGTGPVSSASRVTLCARGFSISTPGSAGCVLRRATRTDRLPEPTHRPGDGLWPARLGRCRHRNPRHLRKGTP